MTRRRRLLLAVGFLAVAATLGCLVLWLNSPRHRINEESVKLIKNGMTEAEVEAIFGVPAGDYSDGGCRVFLLGREHRLDGKEWIGQALAVDVFFDSSGNVPAVTQDPVIRLFNETLLEKLRDWLGL